MRMLLIWWSSCTAMSVIPLNISLLWSVRDCQKSQSVEANHCGHLQRQFHTGAAMVIELAGLTSGIVFKIWKLFKHRSRPPQNARSQRGKEGQVSWVGIFFLSPSRPRRCILGTWNTEMVLSIVGRTFMWSEFNWGWSSLELWAQYK